MAARRTPDPARSRFRLSSRLAALAVATAALGAWGVAAAAEDRAAAPADGPISLAQLGAGATLLTSGCAGIVSIINACFGVSYLRREAERERAARLASDAEAARLRARLDDLTDRMLTVRDQGGAALGLTRPQAPQDRDAEPPHADRTD